MSNNRKANRFARRAFSLVEVLVSLTITGTLLTATLTALDASFKSYKVTTEGASTHVVTRMVMTRLMTMVRTGWEFGPAPVDVISSPRLESNFLEFTTFDDGVNKTVIRVERRAAADGQEGPFVLWYNEFQFVNGARTSSEERPMLTGVTEATFTLEYDVGPRLKKATVDLTVRPNDYQDAKFGSSLETPTIRMVSSVAPRRLIEN